eukprot:TRINITY_DN29932_c0_g1_i1.p3 TRINITY_DN29932_c0_g1~~TRINITY_DN29932_c0_g1_i1.p3  ORF type:complete len:136 (+),score=39.25 TRINITY_DN29932_c0_g1_i1:117-524(+)
MPRDDYDSDEDFLERQDEGRLHWEDRYPVFKEERRLKTMCPRLPKLIYNARGTNVCGGSKLSDSMMNRPNFDLALSHRPPFIGDRENLGAWRGRDVAPPANISHPASTFARDTKLPQRLLLPPVKRPGRTMIEMV